MARSKTNTILDGLRGGLGKQIVVKQYDYGTVVTKYPDMENIKPSRRQKKGRGTFKEAVAYAQSITRDPLKKAAYQATLPPGKRVYNAAIKEYLHDHK